MRQLLDNLGRPIKAEDVADLTLDIGYTEALWTLRHMEHAGELTSSDGTKSSGYTPVFSVRLDVTRMQEAGA